MIGLVVAFVHVATAVEILCKNKSIFVDRAILNSYAIILPDGCDLFEAAVEKPELNMKCPT
jgi:hypothetical protein